MTFYVRILGSGAAAPTLRRHCSSQVLNINGFHIMMDCGESTQFQMRQYHQRLQSVGLICISHLHGDHIFGLPGLLSSMHLCGRKEPVTIFAPQGMRQALEVLFQVSGTELQYELNIIEMDHSEPKEIFRNEHCRIVAFPLIHTMPTYGYYVEEVLTFKNLCPGVQERYNLSPEQCKSIKMGADLILSDGSTVPNYLITRMPQSPRSYAYCCDTAYTEDIIPVIRGVNLLCMESTFGNSHAALAEAKLHCTAAQSAMLAQKAEVDQLVLTHFSARYRDVQPLLDEAHQYFPYVIVANDGDNIEVRRFPKHTTTQETV